MLHRRLTTLLAASTLAAAAGCGGSAPARSPGPAHELSRGVVWGDSLTAAMRQASDPRRVPKQSAVAAGYLERLRLGLGSPFRLIDYAVHDPRLAEPARTRLAWALLARTAGGGAYQIDPAALAAVGRPPRWWEAADGDAHLALIERTIEHARDPRAGEVAVRLAYAIARSEGSVGWQAPTVSAQVAALVRDRALARLDAAALLDEARRTGVDAVTLVPVWRATGRLLVERPPLEPLDADAELEAMRAAPALANALRDLASAPDSASGHGSRPVLGLAAARRLATLASVREAPPQAAVAVTLRSYRARLLDHDLAPRDAWGARAQFVGRVRNEETLAAEYAALVAAGGNAEATAPAADSASGGAATTPTARALPALAVLSAAVAMRAHAQEAVWFPEVGGPTVAQLRDRWGIASVSFDESVPASWRPYYLRLLATGIADLQRVMPALQLRGVGFHFGESALRDSALALHDPSTRTVYLPLATSGGTLAHELAHDLDWQVARTRFGVRGSYSTDRAVREQRSRMAVNLRGLTAATLIPPLPENHYRPPHNRRPAEVFARNADWFVAVSLARQGRTNAFLTSVQDELLTGYAGVVPPDVDGGAALAVADLLDDMTFIAPPTRAGFLRLYGGGRSLGPYDLVRRALAYPADSLAAAALADSGPPWSTAAGAFSPAPVLTATASCVRASDERAEAKQALIERAAEARARGVLRQAAHRAHADSSTAAPLRALFGGPWAPALGEQAVVRGAHAVIAALDARDAVERPFATACVRR